MPTVTLQKLLDRAKATSDMRDNFVTPTQWVDWANQERQSLDLFLARSGWVDPLVEGTTLTNSAGTYTLTLASGVPGIMAIIGIWETTANSVRRLAHEDAVSFYRQTVGNTTNPSGHAKYYRLIRSGDTVKFNFYPEPNLASETYVVAYLPLAQPLSLTAGTGLDTSVSYPMGWEERIVLGMARRALIKEESSTSAVDSEIKLWESRIEEACWSKNMSEVPAIRNVDRVEYGWVDRIDFPPPYTWSWL
jgi:hypothetical protein